jgi:hypothetical protein
MITRTLSIRLANRKMGLLRLMFISNYLPKYGSDVETDKTVILLLHSSSENTGIA